MASEDDVESQYNRLVEALRNRQALAVIESLVKERPQQVLLWQGQHNHRRTPLHCALVVYPPVLFEVIQYLVHQCPSSLEVVDNSNLTPLHLACDYRAGVGSIFLLIQTYPKAAEMTDIVDRTPLHCACRSKKSVQVVRCLLETYPKAVQMLGRGGHTPLHLACYHVKYAKTIQLLMKSFPPAAHVQANFGESPLHIVWWFNPVPREIEYLATAWPVASLLYMKGNDENPPKLPMDLATAQSVRVIHFMQQTTIDAAYGLIDAMSHPSSGWSEAELAGMVPKTLSLDTSAVVATFPTDQMITRQKLELPAIKELLQNDAVQALVKQVEYANLVHGFIIMNQSGRREALKVGTSKSQGIAVCASVSENVACLFAHLRENPSLCWRQEEVYPPPLEELSQQRMRKRAKTHLTDQALSGKIIQAMAPSMEVGTQATSHEEPQANRAATQIFRCHGGGKRKKQRHDGTRDI